MTPTNLFLIEGTFGGDWAKNMEPESFRMFLVQQGFTASRVEWTTNVDGVLDVLAAPGNRDWMAGALSLRERLADVPYEDRNVLCHSSGVGLPLYQAAVMDPDYPPPQPIRRLLSVCSPPRKDLDGVAIEAGRTNMIAAWRHIYATGWDLWATLGQVGDGHWSFRRSWDLNLPILTEVGEPDIGHAELFTPKKRQRFVDGGHFAFLRGTS